MRYRLRDLFATVLVVALVVPYVAYLLTGRWPTAIGSFGGMAFVGLVLGVAALLTQASGDRLDRTARAEEAMAAAVFVLGLVALLLHETAAAAVLLAAFMVSILVVWAVELADHAGLVRHPVHSER